MNTYNPKEAQPAVEVLLKNETSSEEEIIDDFGNDYVSNLVMLHWTSMS